MSTIRNSLGAILSLDEERHRATVSCLPILTDRRSKFRYPLVLGVRFHFRFRELLLSRQGRTINLSAGGLLVASQDAALPDQITVGARLELNIEWPVLLDGRIPLQLFASGQVVRRRAIDFAVALDRHEFRTMRSASRPAAHSKAGVVPWPPSKNTILD